MASESTTTNRMSPASSPRPGNSPPETSFPLEESLLYLDRRTLRGRAIDRGSEEILGRLPSVDVTAAVGGETLAYVVPSAPSPQDEDFIALPELHVREVATGSESLIGPGVAPLWHPGGTRLAYLEPRGERVCEGEICEGSAAVVIADVRNEQRRTVLRPGRWVLLAWLGNDLVVADQDGQSAMVVDVAGDVEELDLAPNQFWGASPDGRWVVAVRGGEVRFLHSARGPRASWSVDLSGRVLAAGSWSPTSDALAAVVLGPGGSGRSTLALIDRTTGLDEVEGSRGAAGPVLWVPDGSSYVYVRSSGRRGLRLEAVHCEIDDPAGCTPVLSWTRGVIPLALASRR